MSNQINKIEIEKQLFQILKNPERHDMQEWFIEAQDSLDNGRLEIEVPSRMTKTNNPICISTI